MLLLNRLNNIALQWPLTVAVSILAEPSQIHFNVVVKPPSVNIATSVESKTLL